MSVVAVAPAVTPNEALVSPSSGSADANNGLNGDVLALALMGTHAYVGGAFTQTADNNVTNLNSVARLSSGSWVALPDYGLNNRAVTMSLGGGRKALRIRSFAT